MASENTRIYAVTAKESKDVALVEASHPSQALRHIAEDQYSVEIATTKQVALLVGAGQVVEKAGLPF